ncbi:hypothetical protein U8527_09070 [Kordia algicida OT-1]|uniref:Uncharacterized protein n=1 Tax=Kordia algicida OT-1 TaxID=391587 RepID=A9DU36_9FLAO|nr:hypothetical protein [Kordia algicida]EDP96250.1 hypothetical protein KAOT1_02537 [Kordia algicida OT-1]
MTAIATATTIKKGIGIHTKLPKGFDAIQINSGVIHHTDHQGSQVNYEHFSFTPLYIDEAYIPKRDWRSLEASEINILTSNSDLKDHNHIYLGEIPEKAKQYIKEIDFSSCKGRNHVMDRFAANKELTMALNVEMSNFLQTISNDKPFHLHCITANLPNVEMVACDITRLPEDFTIPEKKYMGMHNDGTQFMTLHTTYKHGNRICINLGEETRYFLYINLSMIQVHNMLKEVTDISKVNVYNVAETFFKHFPDYPVIRMAQEPGQYYIAPTDNCFHDGSTLGNNKLDINMVYFGNFTH